VSKLGFEIEFLGTHFPVDLPMLLRKHRYNASFSRTLESHALFDVTIEVCSHPGMAAYSGGLCYQPELITRAVPPQKALAVHGAVATWLQRGALPRRYLQGSWSSAPAHMHATVEVELRSVPDLMERVAGFGRRRSNSQGARRVNRMLADVRKSCRNVSESYCGLLALVCHVGFETIKEITNPPPRWRPKYVFDGKTVPLMSRSHIGDLFRGVQRQVAAPLLPLLLRHVASILGPRAERRMLPFAVKPYMNSNVGNVVAQAPRLGVAAHRRDTHWPEASPLSRAGGRDGGEKRCGDTLGARGS
jgi:hypothetical protein